MIDDDFEAADGEEAVGGMQWNFTKMLFIVILIDSGAQIFSPVHREKSHFLTRTP